MLRKRLKPTSIVIATSIIIVVASTIQKNRRNHQYSDREALSLQFQ
jgi:hypothetical protein